MAHGAGIIRVIKPHEQVMRFALLQAKFAAARAAQIRCRHSWGFVVYCPRFPIGGDLVSTGRVETGLRAEDSRWPR